MLNLSIFQLNHLKISALIWKKQKLTIYIIIRYTPERNQRVAYIFMVMSEVESITIKELPDFSYWEDDSLIRPMNTGRFLKTRFIEQCDSEKYCNYRDGRIYHVTDEGFIKFKDDFNILYY